MYFILFYFIFLLDRYCYYLVHTGTGFLIKFIVTQTLAHTDDVQQRPSHLYLQQSYITSRIVQHFQFVPCRTVYKWIDRSETRGPNGNQSKHYFNEHQQIEKRMWLQLLQFIFIQNMGWYSMKRIKINKSLVGEMHINWIASLEIENRTILFFIWWFVYSLSFDCCDWSHACLFTFIFSNILNSTSHVLAILICWSRLFMCVILIWELFSSRQITNNK